MLLESHSINNVQGYTYENIFKSFDKPLIWNNKKKTTFRFSFNELTLIQYILNSFSRKITDGEHNNKQLTKS